MLTWRHPLLPPRNLFTKVIMYFVESTTFVMRQFLGEHSKNRTCDLQLSKLALYHCKAICSTKNSLQNTQCSSEQITGQSRVTLVTHDKGCVRYPTEGNSSNHELTTAMQHLSIRLAATDVSASLRMDF